MAGKVYPVQSTYILRMQFAGQDKEYHIYAASDEEADKLAMVKEDVAYKSAHELQVAYSRGPLLKHVTRSRR